MLFKVKLKYHLASENDSDFPVLPAEGISGSFLYISWFHATWHKPLPSNEYSGLISFGMDWLDLLA